MVYNNQSLQSAISSYRGKMMGLAIICIMLFHEQMWFKESLFSNQVINEYGDWGVDLFFFLSGFGLFYSLSKNEDCLAFYKKRLLRILPACIVAAWAFYLIRHHADMVSAISRDRRSFVLALTGLNLWYIRSILFYYLLTPFFVKIIKRQSTMGFVWLCLLSAAAFLACNGMDFHPFYKNIATWTLSRLPIFLVGIYIATRRDGGVRVFPMMLAALVGLGLLVVIRIYGPVLFPYGDTYVLYRFAPTLLLMPSFLLLPNLFMFLEQFLPSFVGGVLEWMGRYSLELYVCHEGIFALFKKAYPDSQVAHIWAFALSFVCAWVLKAVCEKMVKACRLV